MKCVPTLARTVVFAAGAVILSSGLAVAPARAAVDARICSSADAMADAVYEQALATPKLYKDAAAAAAAAKAAYTRRILSEDGPYTGNGRSSTDWATARNLCHRALSPPNGPWV